MGSNTCTSRAHKHSKSERSGPSLHVNLFWLDLLEMDVNSLLIMFRNNFAQICLALITKYLYYNTHVISGQAFRVMLGVMDK